jgi:hypothetical protein
MQDKGNRLEEHFSQQNGFRSIKIQGTKATLTRVNETCVFSIHISQVDVRANSLLPHPTLTS